MLLFVTEVALRRAAEGEGVSRGEHPPHFFTHRVLADAAQPRDLVSATKSPLRRLTLPSSRATRSKPTTCTISASFPLAR